MIFKKIREKILPKQVSHQSLPFLHNDKKYNTHLKSRIVPWEIQRRVRFRVGDQRRNANFHGVSLITGPDKSRLNPEIKMRRREKRANTLIVSPFDAGAIVQQRGKQKKNSGRRRWRGGCHLFDKT